MYLILNNGVHPFFKKGESSNKFLENLKNGNWIVIENISK